jgi:ankyrin repeat protein
VEKGYEKTVKLLVEKSEVNVNERYLFGWTPLFMAVHYQKSSIVELLLATDSVDINLPNNFGVTPFSLAAERKI